MNGVVSKLTDSEREKLIETASDPAAYRANMDAIDSLVSTHRYRYIVAWGKWLGFTPNNVQATLELAVESDAPEDAIQFINGRWMRISDIVSEDNRVRVEELAQ